MPIKQDRNGFTLIEAVVAMAILSVALVPIYGLSSTSLRIATSIKNNVIAANLAQEGVEVVHAVRDGNWLAERVFDDNLPAGDYIVDWDSQPGAAPATLPPWQDIFLKLDPATGKYNSVMGNTTPFKRRITITKVSSVELMVKSNITWTEGSNPKSITLESHLFNWR
jgi:prepilin-type N-terminal cleavage/methylation domain-containing protein